MRLNQIKLSGFKSFAEPTTFQLPGQRVGVVGPNGCGKSNIMDAVRWVLGESKASELRGESMQDVIFNGSGQRKPAGRASVELVFDNADARAGGQWASYTEIAVKRVLTRDGTSSYYINNQPVRRRDVHDVFLGTGLGPRAYAIIGQGTISRIIESRPEELRLFLEEAAGVSKYKERRRETENRLKDTRENLTRVEDILRELNANLDKLEKQAEVAQRYRSLQDQGTLKLHQLWFLKHRDASNEEARVAQAMTEAATALESRLAELRHVEAELETVRQAHYAASDALHQKQGHLAEASLEVSRLEERIRYVVDGRQRVQQRLSELQAQNSQWSQRQDAAHVELEDIAAQIAAAEEQAELQAAQSEEQAAQLPTFEEALRSAQGQANQQRAEVTQVQQQIQVLAADSRNVEEQQRQLGTRRERLAGEHQGLQTPDAQRIVALQAQASGAEEAQQLSDARLHELQDSVPALDEQRRTAQDDGQPRGGQAGRPERPAGGPARAAGESADRRQAQALAGQARAGQPAGTVDADPHRKWLGDGAGVGAARAPERAIGRSAGHRACLRRRCAAVEAGLLFHAGCGDRQHPPHAAAPERSAAPGRCRPEGAAQRLAGGRLHRVEHRRGAGRSRQADARRSDHDPRGSQRVAVCGQLLCARRRAGRHAGPRPGDREPGAPAARPGPDGRRSAYRVGAAGGVVHGCVATPVVGAA